MVLEKKNEDKNVFYGKVIHILFNEKQYVEEVQNRLGLVWFGFMTYQPL